MSEKKELTTQDITLKLGQAFDRVLDKNYGAYRAPEPIVTPFGVRHLDALLGGGIVSSGPVILTATPESGTGRGATIS